MGAEDFFAGKKRACVLVTKREKAFNFSRTGQPAEEQTYLRK